MRNELTNGLVVGRRHNDRRVNRLSQWLVGGAGMLATVAVANGPVSTNAVSSGPSDPVLNLLVSKGIVTEAEATKAQAEAEAMRTNNLPMAPFNSKWTISDPIKSVELFGDIRLRYEDRQAKTPSDEKIDLQRERFAVRLGLRGEAYDDFYYGIRIESSQNPRSSWVSFGGSSAPYGKSAIGINIGQAYIGWRPEDWVDVTLGKMPNPLYTTSLVWDGDLNPEGAAERFKYTVGSADLFATFGQFLYQDTSPHYASGGLGVNSLLGQSADNIFQLAWQAGLTYHFNKDVSAKVAASVYNYVGMQRNISPYYGDTFVGEGDYTGKGTGLNVDGASGYGSSGSLTAYPSSGFPNNQYALNNLTILEIPFELNFKIKQLNARVFGDFAYNLDGAARAEKAAAGYQSYLTYNSATISGFAPQRDDCKAYQAGFALGSKDSLGLVTGSTIKKHAWEVRTYWQHTEQYALDPNLLDSDVFEGRGNLEGIWAAAAYGISANVVGTIRYGYASRINDKLGTGGSNSDIPQINAVNSYNLFQLDMTLKF